MKYEGVTVGSPIKKTVLKKSGREIFELGAVADSEHHVRVSIPYTEAELKGRRLSNTRTAHIQIVRKSNITTKNIGL